MADTKIPECASQQAGGIACPTCGSIAAHREEQAQWGPHRRRLICNDCGSFIRWLSDQTPEQREASRRRGIERWMSTQPPSEEQLAKLRKYGAASRPKTMLEAWRLLAVLARGEGRDDDES